MTTLFFAGVADSMSLTELVLPGTHDTMTSTCDHPYYRTQNLSLAEQLDIGVRFLDIRLTRDMVAAHREWISTISADDILGTIRQFLVDNPRECIIMRVQNANEAKDDYPQYRDALLPVIERNLDLLYVTDPGQAWPTVGAVRGKIVALECSPPDLEVSSLGDGRRWAANWHQNPLITLQDDWDGPTPDQKMEAIRDVLGASLDTVPISQLRLNHVSATNGELGSPAAYADILNPLVLVELQASVTGRGILIYDFVDSQLASVSWETNQRS